METKIQSNKQLNQYLSKGVVNQDSLVGMKTFQMPALILELTDPLWYRQQGQAHQVRWEDCIY